MGDSSLATREVGPGDWDAVLELLTAMDRQYGGAADAARLRSGTDLLVTPPEWGPIALLGYLDGTPAGIAILVRVFPVGDVATALWLEHLFVLAEARGNGLGQSLLRRAARLALARGYDRIDWQADPDNVAAQRTYDRVGGQRVSIQLYRLDDKDIARLARDEG